MLFFLSHLKQKTFMFNSPLMNLCLRKVFPFFVGFVSMILIIQTHKTKNVFYPLFITSATFKPNFSFQNSCPPVKMEIGDPSSLYWSPMTIGDVTWNFNKFLLDKQGVPFKRYDSAVEPLQLVNDIQLVLDGTYKMVKRPSRPKYAKEEL